jgi:hypothetical protein
MSCSSIFPLSHTRICWPKKIECHNSIIFSSGENSGRLRLGFGVGVGGTCDLRVQRDPRWERRRGAEAAGTPPEPGGGRPPVGGGGSGGVGADELAPAVVAGGGGAR